MRLTDAIRAFLSPEPAKAWGAEFIAAQQLSLEENTEQLLTRLSGYTSNRAWTTPTVASAMGVPAIQRAVTLIASTTGMLSVQAFQKGALLKEPPQLVRRPNPHETPGAFYSGTAAAMAKYGEFVWWIASRDGQGRAQALVLVPLHELEVRDNNENRLFPIYRWGSVEGTRYSAANPTGKFVHVKYSGTDPFELRGRGPLQMCGAASSVAVEAQAWAANFYAEGGLPSVVIKHAGELSPEEDEDGYNEAERLRLQWVNRPNNTPRVIDQNIESVDYHQPGQQGAQMLDARQHNNGDAARMFGVPGTLLEFQAQGSSLTYQNLEGEFTKFVKTCLQPLYLEPIEQAMSDLLTRSTVARFNVKGFLRADVKTRYEVHKMAIESGIYDADYAQREEGIAPGDVEYAPVPYSPPAAIPPSVPRQFSTEIRCDGTRTRVRNGVPQAERCDLLLSTTGAFVGQCRRCKKVYRTAA